MGVEVCLSSRAGDLSSDGLNVGQEWVGAKTIVWAAGVKPSTITESVMAPKDSSGRVVVSEDLSIAEYSNCFVVGDQASFTGKEGMPLPGIAPVAIQQGRFAAKQILADMRQQSRGQFQYFDKGMMATIGRSKAVVQVGGLNLTGFVAWLIWVFIHIAYLMQFKSRVFVFFQWIWAYFNFGRGARLIVHKTWRFYSGEKISYDN